MARDMGGRYVGIFLPVSTLIATGYEHSVLNMLLLPVALMAGAPITPVQVLLMNILPVSIGNAIGGSILVGASMTYSFGKFGRLRRR
eukprot:CAMPEP_0205939508 /NCGR_PEP_ID=MMETSP1325-20131115/49810_1 /ASSEMBLY_ACC=CAM_ASM_000708 /TAXON_ID=236786 /ORGANISM="Florenciella sp., Strain RCC1007" /LENGTH=86 /DNA_ID=CAMNT_0053309983 /DNA_START=10 /DNA_END=270 /DNA_ORIENTATION=-